jgi:hypothetical protein
VFGLIPVVVFYIKELIVSCLLIYADANSLILYLQESVGKGNGLLPAVLYNIRKIKGSYKLTLHQSWL